MSTTEQSVSGLGLEAQRQAITAETQRRGLQLVGIVEDAGISGSVADRPGLSAALELVRSGEADGIMVSKLDRLSRSLLHFAELMEQSRREGWALVALDLGVDTSTAQGELMASVLASFASFERRLIGERTKAALSVKRDQGVKLGRPRGISDDTIAHIQQRQADGLSLAKICEELNEEPDRFPTAQGGTWSPSTVSRALKARRQDPVPAL